MCLMEESLLCLTGETNAEVIYEKSSRSMCAWWGSISRRAEVCSMLSWTVSALWENGFCDVVLQHHPPSCSLGHLLEPIASPFSSLICTCSSLFFFFFFQRKPMEHWLCAVGAAIGAWEGEGLLGALICLCRRACHRQSCVNGKIIEQNLLCPTHRFHKW